MQVKKRSAEVAEGKLGVYHDEADVPQEVGEPWHEYLRVPSTCVSAY